jgi:hypothetical protein
MAEASTTPSTTPTPSSTSSSSTPPKQQQYIKASANDSALEPDALRGSEHVLKDVDIQDDEADRRKQISPEEKK